MDNFLNVLGGAGALGLVFVAVIVVLSLFFKAMRAISPPPDSTPEPLAIRGVIGKDTLVRVRMICGVTYESVLFIGHTSSSFSKSGLPPALSHMLILEDPEGRRHLIREKDVRTIEIDPPAPKT
jgi:hypothetical protein